MNKPLVEKKIPRTSVSGRFISISKAAKILKVSPDTLRNWEKQGKLIPSRTAGGARRYSLDLLEPLVKEVNPYSKPRGLISVSKAAKALQVSADTLRNWEEKRIIEAVRTKGGARRFSRAEIRRLQDELGIQPQPYQVKVKTVFEARRLPVPWFRFLTLGTFFVFVLFLCLIAFSFTDQLKNKSNDDKKAKDVLGEATQDLQNQIAQLAGVVESLQKGLYDVQSSQSEPTYIYPQESLQPVSKLSPSEINLGSEAKTTYRIVGEIDADLLPSVTDKYNLGSLEKTIHQGFVNNIKGKEADYETVKASNLETSSFGLNGTKIFAGDGSPASDLGSSGNYYFRKDGTSLNSSLYFKANNSWQALNNQSLQSVYEIDNNIVTLDSRDVKINLADTINDSSFNLTMSGQNSFRINDDATFIDQTPFIIDSNGNVGIGEDQPVTKLHLVDDQINSPAGVTIENNNSTQDLDVFRIISDVGGVDNVKARITSSGDLFLDGTANTGGADLAEEYNILDDSKEGDVVVSDGGTEVIKSFQSYQNGILGVISKRPGIILGLKKEDTFSEHFNPKPVALNGRVPVKVSTENGPILVGDYLTSSSIPGVAMKATRPGPVIGKALENFPPNSSRITHSLNGKVLTFINVSFADPGQALANMVLDEKGELVIPKIKTTSISLGNINRVNLDIAENQQTIKVSAKLNFPVFVESSAVDIAAKLYSIDSRLDNLESRESSSSAALANIESTVKREQSRLDELLSNLSAHEASSSALALDLNPPEELLVDQKDPKLTEDLSSENLLTAGDVTISGVFKSLGNSFLGNTTIAGDLVVDGTFSITDGSHINALPIIYIQDNPLAEAVDFFNGEVTIDKDGNLVAQTITVAEFRVLANKISGSGQIKAGSKIIEIKNSLVGPRSRILITPTSETNLVLAVTDKSPRQGFTVSSPLMVNSDISFDWWMVNEVEPQKVEK